MKILIIGIGARARCDADIVRSLGMEVHEFIDAEVQDDEIVELVEWSPTKHAIISHGDAHRRNHLVELLSRRLTFTRIISPRAYVSDDASIMMDTVIYPNATIMPHAVVGAHTKVDAGCVVSHDCHVGAYVNLAAGVVLGGRVRVGKLTSLHVNSAIIPGVSVGEDCVVGAGAVVLRDVRDGRMVFGNPARAIPRGAQ